MFICRAVRSDRAIDGSKKGQPCNRSLNQSTAMAQYKKAGRDKGVEHTFVYEGKGL